MRPVFTSNRRLMRRATKIVALTEAKTPEARKARKQMNEHVVRREKTNLNGFFGEQITRGKEKRKGRKIRMSGPMRAASKGEG